MSEAVTDLNQAGAMFPAKVRNALPDLRAQCQRAIDAQESFTDACKAIAKGSGLEPTVIKAYVTAAVRDKLEEQEKRAGQMTLLCEEIG